MTNIHAHSFHAWFENNSAGRVRQAISNDATCARLYDKFDVEIWSLLSERAAKFGGDIMELLCETFGIDMIDTVQLFKSLAVRLASESVAVELICPLEAA